jgi:hypothetical protein
MNRQFLVRIEQQGGVKYQAVRSQREAINLANVFAAQPQIDAIAVLDAAGRVIWRTAVRRDA